MVQYTKTLLKKNRGTLCLYKLYKRIPEGHQKKMNPAESHAYSVFLGLERSVQRREERSPHSFASYKLLGKTGDVHRRGSYFS